MGLSDRSDFDFFGFINTSSWDVLQRLVESTVAWFNQHRLLEPIGYITPAEAEANYYRQLASQTTAVVV